jgi:ATP-dependent Clp protease ATP-binding subunit ClpX
MEDVLGPIMFEVPSTDQVAKVIVTRESVVDGAAPTIIAREPARVEKTA